MTTENEKRMQEIIDRLQSDRREEDKAWRKNVDAANTEQLRLLRQGEVQGTRVETRVIAIEGRLIKGDERMDGQDERHSEHIKRMDVFEARLKKIEARSRFVIWLVKIIGGALGTLGLGWLALKLGIK